MNHVRVGSTFRAVRLELRLRQCDVAERAGVSQETVSRLEQGRLGPMPLGTVETIAAALDADVVLSVQWRGPKLARLLDRRHARLQDLVVAFLVSGGWQVRVEETFNHFGERGSVDILAWRADARALLIVEIKSELVDLQDLASTADRKLRIVPAIVASKYGWRAEHVAGVVVLPDSKMNRDAVAAHSALMATAFPARTVEIRRWLARPAGPLRGVWFLSNTHVMGGVRTEPASRRVYRSKKGGSDRKAPMQAPGRR